MKKVPILSLVCIGFFLTCVIGFPGTGHAQNPKVVKIGAVFPLSGPVAIYGETYKRSVDTAVEYINKKGGIKSLGGAKLEVVYGDNQMKPAVAASETERLITQEKVVAIIGVPPSATTLAGSAVAERLQVPYLDPTSFADQLCTRGFKYFFEIQPTAYYIVDTQVKFLTYYNNVTKANVKRVAIIHEDTDYGKSLSRSQRELLPKAGFEIVGDIEYNAKSPDLSSAVLKLKASNPQFVIQSSYFPDSLSIAKTANRIGLHVPFLDAQGKAVRMWLKAAGPLAEGDFIPAQWNNDLKDPLSQEIAKLHMDKYKEKAFHTISAAQVIFILKVAMETAASADPKAINEALHEIEILPGPDLLLPVEKIKFDKTGMNIYGRPMIVQVQDGEFVTVYPDRFAKKQPIKVLDEWKK